MLLIGLVVALIAVGLGSQQTEQITPAVGGRATLTIMDLQPLAVSGRGFKPNERVVVTTASARKTVMANAAGRFVVRFAGLRCVAGSIRAAGSKGSRAVTQPPKILCVAP
ncbi:MAG: hypothetical protein ACRDNH_06035 [Gaiellaceae bacterium]